MVRHLLSTTLILAVACGGKNTPPLTEQYGECSPDLDGENQDWVLLTELGYVDVWDTATYVIDNPDDWSALFPETDPTALGVDFSTHVVAGATWNTGGCDWPTEQVTQMVSDGTRAHVEITFDHTGTDTMCDMGILAVKMVVVPRHDDVTVCLVTKEDAP